jgi:hypothetical protein
MTKSGAIFAILINLSLYAETETTAQTSIPESLGVYIATNGASLQLLDKITGRMNTISLKIDEVSSFGTLRIKIKYCQKNPPEEPPESKVFIKIWEEKIGQDEKTPLFSNWMFSSSPSLSTLEHPVYGVWIKECVDIKP